MIWSDAEEPPDFSQHVAFLLLSAFSSWVSDVLIDRLSTSPHAFAAIVPWQYGLFYKAQLLHFLDVRELYNLIRRRLQIRIFVEILDRGKLFKGRSGVNSLLAIAEVKVSTVIFVFMCLFEWQMTWNMSPRVHEWNSPSAVMEDQDSGWELSTKEWANMWNPHSSITRPSLTQAKMFSRNVNRLAYRYRTVPVCVVDLDLCTYINWHLHDEIDLFDEIMICVLRVCWCIQINSGQSLCRCYYSASEFWMDRTVKVDYSVGFLFQGV